MLRGWFIRTMLALLALSGASDEASAACLTSVSVDQIAEATARAEAALSRADGDAYRAADDEIGDLLPCVDAMVPMDLAAAVHRTGGVRAFLDRDLERAAVRFATARYLEPNYTWPEEVLPATHPIRRAYLDKVLTGLRVELPARPRRGVAVVDGRIGQGRIEGLPAFFQVIGHDGSPQISTMVLPNDPLPGFVVHTPVRVRTSTLVAISAAVGAIAMFGAASGERTTYNDLDTPYSDLDGLRSRIVGYTIASGTLSAVGAGAGVAAVVPGTRR